MLIVANFAAGQERISANLASAVFVLETLLIKEKFQEYKNQAGKTDGPCCRHVSNN